MTLHRSDLVWASVFTVLWLLHDRRSRNPPRPGDAHPWKCVTAAGIPTPGADLSYMGLNRPDFPGAGGAGLYKPGLRGAGLRGAGLRGAGLAWRRDLARRPHRRGPAWFVLVWGRRVVAGGLGFGVVPGRVRVAFRSVWIVPVGGPVGAPVGGRAGGGLVGGVAPRRVACYGYSMTNNLNAKNVDLSNQALPHLNLTGVSLRGINLTDADVTGATMSDVDLTGANLLGADFTLSDLCGVKLVGADLRHALFENALLRNVDFTGANLLGINMCGSRIGASPIPHGSFGLDAPLLFGEDDHLGSYGVIPTGAGRWALRLGMWSATPTMVREWCADDSRFFGFSEAPYPDDPDGVGWPWLFDSGEAARRCLRALGEAEEWLGDVVPGGEWWAGPLQDWRREEILYRGR